MDRWQLVPGHNTFKTKRDGLCVEDTNGLVHDAQLGRTYDEDGHLRTFSVFTACIPSGATVGVQQPHGGELSELPAVGLGDGFAGLRFVIVKYFKRGIVTCVRCVAVPKVF